MIDYYNPHFLYTTFFGIGKIIKKGAGTIGSIIAFPLVIFLFKLSHLLVEIFTNYTSNVFIACFIIFIILILLFIIGAYSSNKYSKLINRSDPGEIIIDEIIGQALVIVATLPFTNGLIIASSFISYFPNIIEIGVVSCLASFILFRAFDILKPWPINWIDKNIKGGIGVMLDDIAAALLAIIVYYFILFYVVIDIILK